MKRTLLLSILVFLICGLNFNAAAAQGVAIDVDVEEAYNYKITEREAAKIAFCDYIRQNGEIMIPELGLRVVSVSDEGENYVVTLAIYEKITNKIVNECATYTLNSRNGRIVSVKKLRASSTEVCAEQLASEILAGNYSNADAADRAALESAKQAAMAKVMNGEGSLEAIAKYFDNRQF